MDEDIELTPGKLFHLTTTYGVCPVGHIAYGDDEFCPSCGRKIAYECPVCGDNIKHQHADYCGTCGELYPWSTKARFKKRVSRNHRVARRKRSVLIQAVIDIAFLLSIPALMYVCIWVVLRTHGG